MDCQPAVQSANRVPATIPAQSIARGLARWAAPLSVFGINLYICRELFHTAHLAYMNSMQGFWMALARLAGDHWWRGGWWPYWDGGMPFEYTYTPLVPGVTALLAWITGSSLATALHALTGLVWCVTPPALYWMSRRATNAVVPGLLGALAYSLLSPASLLAPDAAWRLGAIRDARQFYVAVVWDELPHLLALALLPLAVIALVEASKTHAWRPRLAATVAMAAMMLASAFGAPLLLLATACLLAAVDRGHRQGLCLAVAASGTLAYLIACPHLSPSMLLRIEDQQAFHDHGWTRESLWAACLVVGGGLLLAAVLRKTRAGWWLRFLVLFTFATTMIVWLHRWLNWRLLPQPGRYKIEMEMAWALLAGYAVWRLAATRPRLVRLAALVALLLAGWPQVVKHRRYAKDTLRNRPPITDTIEYQAALWLNGHLPGQKVFLPGSMAMWLNTFAENPQLSGGNWSTAMSRAQQLAVATILSGEDFGIRDPQVSLLWLKAYGVRAIAVTGPESSEFWKPYRDPKKFEGVLPVLWSQDGTTIYQVPRRSDSLAHAVPRERLVRREPARGDEVDELRPYVEALEDPRSTPVEIRFTNPGAARIRAALPAGHVLSVQVSYHAGWKARTGGRPIPVRRDGLGQIWLQPDCPGPCEIALWYDGGLEVQLCRLASGATLAGLLLFLVTRVRVRRRQNSREHPGP